MSQINAELYDALIDAGASEGKARNAARSIGDHSQLATRADLKADLLDLIWRIVLLIAPLYALLILIALSN